MGYSKEEVIAFEKKDLRITRIAMVKSLIETNKHVPTKDEAQNIKELAEEFTKYVYSGFDDGEDSSELPKPIDWQSLARGQAIEVPQVGSLPVLDAIWCEYKSQCETPEQVAQLSPALLCKTVFEEFGSYPKNTASVGEVVSSINVSRLKS